jgi:hypothetical protein
MPVTHVPALQWVAPSMNGQNISQEIPNSQIGFFARFASARAIVVECRIQFACILAAACPREGTNPFPDTVGLWFSTSRASYGAGGLSTLQFETFRSADSVPPLHRGAASGQHPPASIQESNLLLVCDCVALCIRALADQSSPPRTSNFFDPLTITCSAAGLHPHPEGSRSFQPRCRAAVPMQCSEHPLHALRCCHGPVHGGGWEHEGARC